MDKQLSKPVIRLFQNSKALEEVIRSLSKYLLDKNRRKENTLDARLYSIITKLVKDEGPRIFNSQIWDAIKIEIEGYELNQQSYITEDFGEITKTKVTKICIDRFGAQYGGNTGKSRYLIFDEKKIFSLAINYSLSTIYEIVDTTEKTDTLDTYYSSTEISSADQDRAYYSSLLKKDSKDSKAIVRELNQNSNTAVYDNIRNPSEVSEVSEVSRLLVKPEKTKTKFFKCPLCKFENIHIETVEHHKKHKHDASKN